MSIKAFWFWINDRRKRNQSRTGADFNQSERDEYQKIYRDVQERTEAKHDNDWKIPKWDSKTSFPEWDDFLVNTMKNDKYSVDKHTPIMYLLRKYETPTATADLPAGLSRLEKRCLQVLVVGDICRTFYRDLKTPFFETT